MRLEDELATLLNCHSVENASDTPDFLLAEYMLNCLDAYERITQGRDAWYGMNPEPGVEWRANGVEAPRDRQLTKERPGRLGHAPRRAELPRGGDAGTVPDRHHARADHEAEARGRRLSDFKGEPKMICDHLEQCEKCYERHERSIARTIRETIQKERSKVLERVLGGPEFVSWHGGDKLVEDELFMTAIDAELEDIRVSGRYEGGEIMRERIKDKLIPSTQLFSYQVKSIISEALRKINKIQSLGDFLGGENNEVS